MGLNGGLKVIVTGASTGIGQATALRFSKDGHDVVASARSDAKLSETVRLAKGKGGPPIHKVVGDVSVEADVKKNFEEASKALGGQVDVLVLNAGTAYVSPFEDISSQEFDKTFNTNVKGVFLWLQAALPTFKKQGFGQIVIINSVGGQAVVAPGFSVYSASKFALTGLAQGLRLDLKGLGIKVASVFPGAVDTPIWAGPEWEKTGENPRENYGLDLALVPDDIADIIADIAYQSPRSDIDKVSVWPNYGLKKKA